jgi:hypothetical protein
MKAMKISPRRVRPGVPCPMAEGVKCDIENRNAHVACALAIGCGCTSCPYYRPAVDRALYGRFSAFRRDDFLKRDDAPVLCEEVRV